MSSVTQRIAQIKQPRGGYIKPSQFEVKTLDDGKILFAEENINPGLIGMTVDYLTRMVMGASAEKSFYISLLGAEMASNLGMTNAKK